MERLSDSALTYKDKQLHMEEVPLHDIARTVSTPVYCYSSAVVERNATELCKAFSKLRPRLCYAVKANSNLAIIRLLANLGIGAEVVSEGELRRALFAGIPADRVVFAGVGKTAKEIAFALEAGILQFNVESEAELESIADTAETLRRPAPVALRVNPNIEAGTHAKITTGTNINKFGIPMSRVSHVYERACRDAWLEPVGLTVHIGSQLTELQPFRLAFDQVVSLARNLGAMGLPVSRLDFGGGLGVRYRDEQPPSFAAYAAMVESVAEGIDCQLLLEPGRCLVANSGVLLARVILGKRQESRSFVVLDAAINDLLRPGLYEAQHSIVPVSESDAGSPLEPVDFVGPVCETTDTFSRDTQAPKLNPNDLVVLLTTGAYGAVMASTYNSRPLVPEVLIRGDRFDVIRQRETYDDMLARDRVPEWLLATA